LASTTDPTSDLQSSPSWGRVALMQPRCERFRFARLSGVVSTTVFAGLFCFGSFKTGAQEAAAKEGSITNSQGVPLPSQKAGGEAGPPGKETAELAGLRAENARLREEVLQLREQLASGKSAETPATGVESKPTRVASPDLGRELALEVARGEPTAMDRLSAMAKEELQNFHRNSTGLSDSERGETGRQTFAPLRSAFNALGEEALKGNQYALQAISRALTMPELRGNAVESAGVLAGNGDETALKILTHPDNYGLLLSSAVGALKLAADRGSLEAIEMLAAVGANPKHRALWFLAATGLEKAAASGNAVAIDTLAVLVKPGNNESVRRVAITGLQQAVANQNAKAVEALRPADAP
jgi:hypothetical protein